MEKPTLRALLLAAAVVVPNFVAPITEPAPMKHAEEFSTDELRHTLRAANCTVYESEPLKEGFEEQA